MHAQHEPPDKPKGRLARNSDKSPAMRQTTNMTYPTMPTSIINQPDSGARNSSFANTAHERTRSTASYVVLFKDPFAHDAYFKLEQATPWTFGTLLTHVANALPPDTHGFQHSLQYRVAGGGLAWMRIDPLIKLYHTKVIVRIDPDSWIPLLRHSETNTITRGSDLPAEKPTNCIGTLDLRGYQESALQKEKLSSTCMERIRHIGHSVWANYITDATERASRTTDQKEHSNIMNQARHYFRSHPGFEKIIEREFSHCDQESLRNYILDLTRGLAWYLIPSNRERKRSQVKESRQKRKRNHDKPAEGNIEEPTEIRNQPSFFNALTATSSGNSVIEVHEQCGASFVSLKDVQRNLLPPSDNLYGAYVQPQNRSQDAYLLAPQAGLIFPIQSKEHQRMHVVPSQISSNDSDVSELWPSEFTR